ncbi:hypothetical protein [Streptomyces sp. MST-110588]|uniref:hypothetical protein n=1 Tax=Streptomyces sp. MST-110588 TaxID=2833628 RepID=UPI001F5C280C|nr:hypothetical protein [Streptomyces sp. MST-110588]UNO41848.1 hypothetical protein KGS77_22770 [Streptomyces sp. MST-110588]
MTTPTRPESTYGRLRVGTWLGACLLVVAEVPLAFVTLVQLMPRGGDAVEFDAASKFTFIGNLGIGWAVVCLALTLPFVKTRRLRTWWYVPPLAMLLGLAVRLHFFSPYGG